MPEGKTHLEDAAAPDAKYTPDPETHGEWERAAAESDQSEHLRKNLDDAREAADTDEADPMADSGSRAGSGSDAQDGERG